VTLEGKGEKIAGKLEKNILKLDNKNNSNPAVETLQQLITKFTKDKNISVVEPNYTVSILPTATQPATPASTPKTNTSEVTPDATTPNDPYYSSSGSWGQPYQDLYGMHKIQAETAWDQTTGSANIIVADIDTGVDRNHEDLQGQMWVNTAETPGNGVDDDQNGYVDDYHGWDWYNNDNDPMDDHGHGTHTVGTIAGVGNNAKGVVGVNWTSKIMALKFLSSTGSGSMAGGVAALQYAADMGAKVSSNSWGGGYSQMASDAVKYEHDRGMVVVAAAGNDKGDAVFKSPASADYAITVSASDYDDVKANFSNGGEKIDVAAPGVETLSLKAANSPMCSSRPERIVGTNYCKVSGTSMATPHVAGLAALLLAKNSSLTNEEIRQIIRHGADDLGVAGKDADFGYGRINAANTLNFSNSQPLTPIITSPGSWTPITSSTMNIVGGIKGPNFADYKVEVGHGTAPSTWELIKTSTDQVTNGLLATADVSSLNENESVIFRLTATKTSGEVYQFQVHQILVDNIQVRIISPTTDIYGNVEDIIGTARTINGVPFGNYTLEAREQGGTWGTEGLTMTNGGNQPVTDGKLGTWDTSTLKTNTTYNLRLTVWSADGRSDHTISTVQMDKEVLPGWPKKFISQAATTNTPLAAGDLNNDGQEEIIYIRAPDKKVYVYNRDGSEFAGWPVDIPSPSIQEPVIVDLNGDSKKEIVFRVIDGSVTPQRNIIYALEYDGNNLSGWPKIIPNGSSGPVSVADLDGNGTNEIVFLHFDYGTFDSEIHALNGDGSYVSGFPKRLNDGNCCANPTLVDIESDGKVEIIFALYRKVYVLDSQGNKKSGWPVSIEGEHSLGSALAGDITGDGIAEVIIKLTEKAGGVKTHFDVFDAEGSRLPGWPQRAANSVGRMGPALADATGDGILNIIFPMYGVGGGTIFDCSPLVFDKDGLVENISCGASHVTRTAIVDFDGDGKPDVVTGNDTSKFIDIRSSYIDANGDVTWSVLWEKRPGGVYSQPIVSDLDGDGKWEVISLVESHFSPPPITTSLIVWEPTEINNATNGPAWEQIMGDAARTGTYPVPDSEPPGTTGDLNGDGVVNIFDLSILLSNWGTSDPIADINNDGTVNIFDLSILLSNWDG
jgi:subtilisin family serine protease